MSVHFHPLVVKEVRKETADCVSVAFEIPENLKSSFQFLAGQSLTMRTTLNGEEVRRTYSICSSPLDNEWRVAIKKVEGGTFSQFANEQLKPGDVIEVMQPVGKFNTTLHPENQKNYLAFAAGSGITPVLSLIKTTLRTEPKSSFTLVYGNRSKNSIILKEELEAIKDKYLQRFRMYHVLSRERTDTPLHSGRVDKTKLEELSRVINYSNIHEVFICGPEEMIFSVRDFLEQKNLPKKNIHFELFTTPGMKSGVTKKVSADATDERKAKISLKADGIMFDFEVPFHGETILDAALKKGADLPFACKGGVCTTCKAKLIEGEVEMEVHWGLEEDEVEQGYILTCQSHPVSERVVIDFDEK